MCKINGPSFTTTKANFIFAGALNVPIFGGLIEDKTSSLIEKQASKSVSLYEENLKFGAMPTHPLGTSTGKI